MASSINPRKTPTQRRAQATHDAILEAATQIIASGGLSAFNTNAVAERAGVSIGSLYQYFPNKDALMAAVIHQQQARQLDSVADAGAALEGLGLEAAVRAIIRAAMNHHREDSLLATAIDHEEARLPVDDIVSGYLEQGGELVRRLMARYSADIGEIDLDHAVRTLPVLVRAVVDVWANRTPPLLDVAEDEAVRAVMGYLRGR